MASNFETFHTWDTILSADSVEWCPIAPYKNCFACGLYQLEDFKSNDGDKKKKEYQRTGGVSVFSVNDQGLNVEASIKCAAVLDMKWSKTKIFDKIPLAVANADGEVQLLHFENKDLKLISTCSLREEPGDHLILSLDWVKRDNPDLICSSDSKGKVHLIKVCRDTLTVLKMWRAHSLEAWIGCFDSFNESIIYSGGDDAQLKVWDTRVEDSSRIFVSSAHTAGVTTLNSNAYKEHNLASGSYDETVRFWDTRTMKNSEEMKIRASGGVWRLKWEPNPRVQYLLAACMYGGVQIYDTINFSIVGNYNKHESLVYGADWCFLNREEIKTLLKCYESALLATCSFYDHKICVSLWNEDANLEKKSISVHV